MTMWATGDHAARVYAPHINYTVCAIPTPEGGRANSTAGFNVFAIPMALRIELAGLFELLSARRHQWQQLTFGAPFPPLTACLMMSADRPMTPSTCWDVSLPTAPCPAIPAVQSTELNTEMGALRDEVIYNHSDPLPRWKPQNKLQPQLDNPVW